LAHAFLTRAFSARGLSFYHPICGCLTIAAVPAAATAAGGTLGIGSADRYGAASKRT
jgi:hypothetical protein